MAITHTQTAGGAITVTGDDITIFQLLAVKGALKLEMAGLKSRGGSIRKGWALRLGLKPSAKHAEVIAEIERRVEAAKNPTTTTEPQA